MINITRMKDLGMIVRTKIIIEVESKAEEEAGAGMVRIKNLKVILLLGNNLKLSIKAQVLMKSNKRSQ